jgi:hypothetical protein
MSVNNAAAMSGPGLRYIFWAAKNQHSYHTRVVGMRALKVRAGLETALALCAGTLGIITIFWHDWIEALTGWDPDQHNGSLEWLIVVALLAVAVLVGIVARRHWRMLAALTSA